MLEVKNLLNEVNSVDELYVYKKIARMNGNVLSVVQVADRTLDFHVHENSDEMFCVLEGSFELETSEGLIPLKAGEFIIVPKGTMHRPVVKELAKFLMVEFEGTLNKENSGDKYED
ncbi:MAG: cupin domain-containing protein [Oscillospiraceae bacterium]|nr:cupin domain-containing protein [Oscillospiraceae bacterium]